MKDVSFGSQFQVMVKWADQDRRVCVECCLVDQIDEPCIKIVCPSTPPPSSRLD